MLVPPRLPIIQKGRFRGCTLFNKFHSLILYLLVPSRCLATEDRPNSPPAFMSYKEPA